MSFGSLTEKAARLALTRFDSETVACSSPGASFELSALVNVSDPNMAPLDGTNTKSSMWLVVLAADATGIDASWSVTVRNTTRPVLDVDSSDPMLWTILLGDPEP